MTTRTPRHIWDASTAPQPNNLDYALGYWKRGWRVLPTWSVDAQAPSAVPVAVVDNENGGTLQPTAAELQAIAEKQQELMKKKEEENERNNEIMKECIRILSLNMVFFR